MEKGSPLAAHKPDLFWLADGLPFFILIIFMIKNSIQKSLCFNNVNKSESLCIDSPLYKDFLNVLFRRMLLLPG